jgi:hypothetical protein
MAESGSHVSNQLLVVQIQPQARALAVSSMAFLAVAHRVIVARPAVVV